MVGEGKHKFAVMFGGELKYWRALVVVLEHHKRGKGRGESA